MSDPLLGAITRLIPLGEEIPYCEIQHCRPGVLGKLPSSRETIIIVANPPTRRMGSRYCDSSLPGNECFWQRVTCSRRPTISVLFPFGLAEE
jgi:hypothetical protein